MNVAVPTSVCICHEPRASNSPRFSYIYKFWKREILIRMGRMVGVGINTFILILKQLITTLKKNL